MSGRMPEPQRIGDGGQAFELTRDRIDGGTWLLEASAGTGKTYTIAGLVARWVVEDGLSIERIAVMTFTRAATAELRERIRARLAAVLAVAEGGSSGDPLVTWQAQQAGRTGITRLREALDRLDGALITTIHGFCQRLLASHGLSLGTPPALEVASDATAWRTAWCRDRLRRWAADPALAGWARAGLLPSLADLERWTADIEKAPDALLPEDQPVIGTADLERAVHGARAVFEREALLVGRKKDQSVPETARRRHRAGCDLLAGRWTAGALATLAELTDSECKAHPPLLALKTAAKAAGSVGEALEIAALRAYRSDFRARLGASDGAVSFQDLLTGLAAGLEDGESGDALAQRIADGYDAVLVDEFQDTDPEQWRILARCFARRRLVLIGDPKQAIYRFRGADLGTYLAARSSVPVEHRRTLGVNYRTDRTLHRAIHALMGANPDPFACPEITLDAVAAHHGDRLQPADEDPLTLHLLPGDGDREDLLHAAAQATVAAVTAQLGDRATIPDGDGRRRLAAKDIAVLVGSHDQALLVHGALAAAGIPAVRAGSGSVLRSLEALELGLLLNAWLSPHDLTAVRGAAVVRALGHDPTAVASGDLDALVGACRDDGERWRQHGLPTAWAAFLDRGPRTRLAGLNGGERALVNLQHLIDLLADEEQAGHHAPEGLLHWFDRQRAEADDRDQATLQRLDDDADAVRILTIHVSKGLQFPVVILPFAWAGRQLNGPKLATIDGRRRWIPGKGLPSSHDLYHSDTLQEQARLLYVALTRPVHRLVLFWAATGTLRINNMGSLGSPLGQMLLGHGAPADEQLAHWKDLCKDQGPAAQSEQIRSIVATLPGIGIRDSFPAATLPERPPRPAISPQIITSGPQRALWPSSYTALVHRLHDGGEEADHDGGSAAGPRLRQEDDPDDNPPAGTAFGVVVHGILETALLRNDPLAGFSELAGERWRAAGVPLPWHGPLTRRLEQVLGSPIPGCSTALAAIPRPLRRCEMPFALPVAAVRDLAAAFRRHPLAAHPQYQPRAATVWPGLFTGVIDLVAWCDGAWRIIDWKSNLLPDLAPATLAHEQRRHHYVLQAHLYALALRRHLRNRGEDGPLRCHYAYVRYGAWIDEFPDPALLDDLDAILGDDP